MAHYLDIHSIDKDLVKGIAVIASLDNDHFEEKMVSLLEIVRCDFNDVFRNFFDVNSEWDCNHFIIKAENVRYLIQDLKRELAKGDDGDVYDIAKYHQVMSCLETMASNPDPDATYTLSWEK